MYSTQIRILIRDQKRKNNRRFEASFELNPSFPLKGYGKTEAEAIGHLLLLNKESFNVEITNYQSQTGR